MQATKRTATRFLTLDPIWKEAFLLRVPRAEAVLRVEVKANKVMFWFVLGEQVCCAVDKTLVSVVSDPSTMPDSMPQTTTSPR